MTNLRASEDHYSRVQRVSALTLTALRRHWRQVSLANIDESWLAVGPELVLTLAAGQLAAAQSSKVYVPAVLAEQNIAVDPVAEFVPRSLAGVAADGRPLESLMYAPFAATKTAVGNRVVDPLAAGLDSLTRISLSEVADAGRQATVVEQATRPTVTYYTRMLNPPSCPRCAILAGKVFKNNAGFQRHPKCLPAGVVTSGPALRAATRRWYEGELVILRTASGQELPITGNHPVLTDKGWIPANLIEIGDNVVRAVDGKGAVPLVVPDEQHGPTSVEDHWRSDGVVPFVKMPTTAEDFHGDGGHGDVDVVLVDGLLSNGRLPGADQGVEHETFPIGADLAHSLAARSEIEQALAGELHAARRLVGSGRLGGPLFGRHLARSDNAGLGHAADSDAPLFQPGSYDVATDLVSEAQGVLTLASEVRRRNLGIGERDVASRWDAPPVPFTVESRAGYAARGENLRLRLSGQVSLDRVVKRERVQWSGHVYNLTSTEGWFAANGLIVSNCDCVHVPTREDIAGDLTTDPKAYFNSLSKSEQDAIFTKSGAQAIRDGADMNQVVNARRGMRSVAQDARNSAWGTGPVRRTFGAQTTVEGVTPSAFATTAPGSSITRRGGVRLMPEAIYDVATSHEDVLRLLRANGYVR